MSLQQNSYLTPKSSIRSDNANYHLCMEEDGNLVLYKRKDAYDEAGTPLFAPGTNNKGQKAVVEIDGFKIRDQSEEIVWNSQSSPGKKKDIPEGKSVSLLVQEDGNVVLKDADGEIYWASDTTGGKTGNQLEGVAAPFFLDPYKDNPLIMAACSWVSFGFLGYWALGQKKKAIAAVVYTAVCYVVMLGWIWWILATVDTFLCSQKLQKEGKLAEDHFEIGFLEKLPLWK